MMPAVAVADARAELWRYRAERPITPSGTRTADLLVVTLTLANGLSGWGFSALLDGRDDLPLLAARDLLARFVAGGPLGHPLALWRRLDASFRRTGRGAYFTALAAIDVAAWDLYARMLGVPLGVALGGTPRRVPVYASGRFYPGQDPAEAVAVAREAQRAGYRGVKLRAGGTPHDGRVLRAVAAAVGDDIDVMVDANQHCTPTSAMRLLRTAAEIGARFVEEPLPAADARGYAQLARTAPAPIATGENLHGSAEAAPYLFGGWCSVMQPDLQRMGGLSECLRTAQLAEHCNIEIAPHYLPFLFVHLAAAVPNLTWLEDFPTIDALFAEKSTMTADGYIEPPAVPGHGLSFAAGARETFLLA